MGSDANPRFYRGRSGDQASCLFGFEGQIPFQGDGPIAAISIDDSDSRIPFSAPPFPPGSEYPLDYCSFPRYEDQIETFPYLSLTMGKIFSLLETTKTLIMVR